MKITYNQAQQATKCINENFSDVTGQLALQIYFLKDGIRRAFRPYDEMMQDTSKALQELRSEHQAESEKKDPSKEALQKLNEQAAGIREEMNQIAARSEQIELPKGKIPLGKLSENRLDSVGVLSALDFAIEFEQDQEKEIEKAEEAA